MSIRLGIVMDPIAQINFKKDSSLAMLLAAQSRGWQLFYMEQQDLCQRAGQARARLRPLQVFDDDAGFHDAALAVEQQRELAQRPMLQPLADVLWRVRAEFAELEGDGVLVQRDQHLLGIG